MDMTDILDPDLVETVTVGGTSTDVAWQDDKQLTEDEFSHPTQMATVWISGNDITSLGYRTEIVKDSTSWYVQTWKLEANVWTARVQTDIRRNR